MPLKKDDSKVAIYHLVKAGEGLEESAAMIHQLLLQAAGCPGKPRALFLDIEGHRNAKGGFDHDMYELQSKFLADVVMPFLVEATTPLVSLRNPKPQRDDVPERILMFDPDSTDRK